VETCGAGGVQDGVGAVSDVVSRLRRAALAYSKEQPGAYALD